MEKYIYQNYFDENEIIYWKQRWKILSLVRIKDILEAKFFECEN